MDDRINEYAVPLYYVLPDLVVGLDNNRCQISLFLSSGVRYFLKEIEAEWHDAILARIETTHGSGKVLIMKSHIQSIEPILRTITRRPAEDD